MLEPNTARGINLNRFSYLLAAHTDILFTTVHVKPSAHQPIYKPVLTALELINVKK